MNTVTVLLWIFGAIDVIVIIGGAWFFIWLAFFDKRLRILMFNKENYMSMFKVPVKDDRTFTINGKTYVTGKQAIYRRFNRIPYSIYFYNNPNPIIINEQKGNIEYTAQEVHGLIEMDYTLKLIKQRIDVKKVAITMAVIIGIGIVLLAILHFTGVINIQEFLGVAPKT